MYYMIWKSNIFFAKFGQGNSTPNHYQVQMANQNKPQLEKKKNNLLYGDVLLGLCKNY